MGEEGKEAQQRQHTVAQANFGLMNKDVGRKGNDEEREGIESIYTTRPDRIFADCFYDGPDTEFGWV